MISHALLVRWLQASPRPRLVVFARSAVGAERVPVTVGVS